MEDNIQNGLVEEVAEFISNRLGSKFITDRGRNLQNKVFSYIEEYKRDDNVKDSEAFDDLVNAFMEVISYYERRSYKLGVADGLRLISIKDNDIIQMKDDR